MGRGKIPDEVIQEMRKQYHVDITPMNKLVKTFGKPYTTIYSIVNYENYVHVPDTFDVREIRRSVG